MTILISNLLQGLRIAKGLEGGMAMEESCMWGSQEHSQIQWFRTQHRAVSMAKIYYSERTQSKSSKRNRHTAVWRKHTSFKSPLPVASRRTYFVPLELNMITQEQCPLPGKLIRNTMPSVFTESYRHAPPSLARTWIPDTQRSKQLLSKNHIACTHSSGTGSPADQLGNRGTFLKSEFPDTCLASRPSYRGQPQACYVT